MTRGLYGAAAMRRLLARLTMAVVCAVGVASWGAGAQGGGGTGPIIVVETTRGTFECETYPDEAPQTVAHVVALVNRGFYDGQRVHRAVPGFVMQFGDPQSRDLTKRHLWGRGDAASSGQPVGIAEITKKRANQRGAVAMAHMGDPSRADSQIYVALADRPDLNGKYVVFGQVIAGEDVPEKLQVGDVIRRVYVKL